MKTKNTHFIIHIELTTPHELIQKEAEILHQFEHKGRLWIVHNSWTFNKFGSWFVISDYITGIQIGTSYMQQKEAIYQAKKLLRPYTYAQVEEKIHKTVAKYNITKFNKP